MVYISICDDSILVCLAIAKKVHALLLKTGVEHTVRMPSL